jgi:Protein of unknown function (DUF3341)
MRDRDWSGGVYMAEFASAADLTRAAQSFHRKGYRMLETYSPVPLADGLEYRRSRLPKFVFGVGALGGLLSYGIQWYANAYSYPLNIGGRPSNASTAFFIPTFEGTVLAASLAAFVGVLWILRLPQPWHPVFELPDFERATIDRYWLAVDARDPRGSRELTVNELREFSPLRVVALDPEPAP